MPKIQLDFTSNPNNDQTLANELKAANLKFQVLENSGPGGGNPYVQLEGTREAIEKYLPIYCGGDTVQANEFLEAIED